MNLLSGKGRVVSAGGTSVEKRNGATEKIKVRIIMAIRILLNIFFML
jgi:hypothetical protein